MQSERQRAAASYYRSTRASYAETCRVFDVPSFDANAGYVTRLDRLLVWALDHEGYIIVLEALAVLIGGAILLQLITDRA